MNGKKNVHKTIHGGRAGVKNVGLVGLLIKTYGTYENSYLTYLFFAYGMYGTSIPLHISGE